MKYLLSLFTVLAIVGSPVIDAEAAAKKKVTKRTDYTKAQQKKFFDDATKLCRKQHGAKLHRVQVNYAKRQYVCWAYT